MNVKGEDLRPCSEFRFTWEPHRKSPALFIAVTSGEVHATRKFNELLHLPDATQVIANWHGANRTDGFLTTVGALRAKAAAWHPDAKVSTYRV